MKTIYQLFDLLSFSAHGNTSRPLPADLFIHTLVMTSGSLFKLLPNHFLTQSPQLIRIFLPTGPRALRFYL